jgi:hypothetical protein
MSSASMTGDLILARVKQVFGNPSTSVWTDAIVTKLLNNAYYMDICAKFDFHNLLATVTGSTVAGTATVTYNTYNTGTSLYGTLTIKGVTIPAQNAILEPVNVDDYERFGARDTTNVRGIPSHYYRKPDATSDLVLEFYPCPDAVYSTTVSYRMRPAPLVVSGTPTPTVLPDEWDEVLINFAAARYARHLRLFTDAKEFYAQAQLDALTLVGVADNTTSNYNWDPGGAKRGKG